MVRNGYMTDLDASKFLNENEQGDNESDYDFIKRIYSESKE